MNRFSTGRAIKDEQQEQSLFSGRAKTGFLIITVCILVLLGRFFYLQVVAYGSFSTRSESNRVSVRPVVPNRTSVTALNEVGS